MYAHIFCIKCVWGKTPHMAYHLILKVAKHYQNSFMYSSESFATDQSGNMALTCNLVIK